MWRKILLIFMILLLTGCTKVDSNNEDYISVVYNSFSNEKMFNDVGIGYKFYVPRGVKLIKNYDYNQKFLVDDDNIYLYIDIISYYYKNESNYKNKNKDKNYFYYKDISFNDKKGYISIEHKEHNIYYVNIFYNYARIEFYCDKKRLNKMIGISSSIISNISYNDTMISNILADDYNDYKKIRYKVDKPEEAGSNFSQYLKEYIKDEVEELPDK